MSARKLNIFEILIEGYIKAPPSLKEQAVTQLSIQLCQNIELKKDIIFQSEYLHRLKYSVETTEWDALIEKRSTSMCKSLQLPPALKNFLIVRIQTIAMQLFTWNRQQVMLNLSPHFADSLLSPSDWTVEMKLDEKKIAERLVQDERIPICQRYKMACIHCLESYIYSLWDQISTELRDDLLLYNESKLVQLWTYHLSGKVEDLIPSEDLFWFHLLKYGIKEGSRSTVFHYWDKLNMNSSQNVLIDAALAAVLNIYNRIDKDVIMYVKDIASPAPYVDILCFLLAQMSEEQRVAFFQTALQDTEHTVLKCFLYWPYMDLLLPIVEELWGILPEEKYRHLLLILGYNYSDYCDPSIRINGYVDYEYGSLMIELLKVSPNNFKRYAFGYIYDTDTNTFRIGKLLYVVIRKDPLQVRNIKIFQNVWQHATLEEKRSFLRTHYGESFCCYLAILENWELLNSVIRECLPEKDIVMIRKKILRSELGRKTCFAFLIDCNKELLNSWLNWGFPSKKEIFQFILKIFFRDHRFDSKQVYDFKIDTNFLYSLIERYAPSEDAKRKFKSRFVKVYSKDVCAYLIFNSKWQELENFLNCGFPSERNRERFKKWFVEEFAMQLCEECLYENDLDNSDQFLTWCFSSKEAVEQFRQELFFFSGPKLQWNVLDHNSQDLDSLIKWFRLDPVAILKFKKEFLFRPYFLSYSFSYLTELETYHIRRKELFDYQLQHLAIFLKWGLADEETAIGLKDASKIYLMDFPFNNDEVRQWVQRTWYKLIYERIFDLSTEQKLVTQVY